MGWQPKTIGERIKELRKACHMSQGDVGKALGVTNTSVCNWERGVCTPRIPEIKLLADLFNCSMSDLTGIVPPPQFDACPRRGPKALHEYTDIELLDELRRRMLTVRTE